MTRVLAFSDLHLEFGRYACDPYSAGDHMIPEADIAVVAGDIAAPVVKAVAYLQRTVARHMPVIYVAGNHEFYSHTLEEEFDRAREHLAVRRDDCNEIHLLEDETAIVAGIRFIGATLWTDYELYVGDRVGKERDIEIATAMDAARRMIRDHQRVTTQPAGEPLTGFAPRHARSRHQRSRAYIESVLSQPFEGPTVVVTHHAPHPDSVEERFKKSVVSPAFASDLSALIAEHEPELWVHGHVHSSHDYRVGRTRVVANPAGYVIDGRLENTAFDVERIIEVGRR